MDALLIDDSTTMLLRFRTMLEQYQGVSVTAFAHPAAALLKAREQAFDIVLVDQHMPDMDGVEFIRELCGIPHYAQVPVIMITSDSSEAIRLAALEAGATDFLDKRTESLEFKVRLRNQIRLAAAIHRLGDHAAKLAGEVNLAIRHIREREEEIIFRLALAVEYRDNDTGQHTWRVARYSQIMAEALGLNSDLCHRIYLAAPLHDVGKVAISDEVLLKKARLSETEMETVRAHAAIGERILGDSSSELIRLAAEIAGGHHEKWDGSGYPRGSSGLAIPLAARIVAVADVFDALTTVRPYKDALPPRKRCARSGPRRAVISIRAASTRSSAAGTTSWMSAWGEAREDRPPPRFASAGPTARRRPRGRPPFRVCNRCSFGCGARSGRPPTHSRRPPIGRRPTVPMRRPRSCGIAGSGERGGRCVPSPFRG